MSRKFPTSRRPSMESLEARCNPSAGGGLPNVPVVDIQIDPKLEVLVATSADDSQASHYGALTEVDVSLTVTDTASSRGDGHDILAGGAGQRVRWVPDVPAYRVVLDPRSSETGTDPDSSNTNGYFTNDYSLTVGSSPATLNDNIVDLVVDPRNGEASGYGSNYKYIDDPSRSAIGGDGQDLLLGGDARDTLERTSHELGHMLGFRHEHTRPASEANGDGFDDVIVGATINGHVKVFDGSSGALIRSFYAYEGFTGGIRIAAADLTGDGLDPQGLDPHNAGGGRTLGDTGTHEVGHWLKLYTMPASASTFDQQGRLLIGTDGGIWNSPDDTNGHGTHVAGTIGAVGNNGVGVAKPAGGFGYAILVGGAIGSPYHSSAELASFLAFPGFTGGVSVATGDVDGNGRADIIMGAGAGAGHHLKASAGTDTTLGGPTTGNFTLSFNCESTSSQPDLYLNIWINQSELESVIDDLAREPAVVHKQSLPSVPAYSVVIDRRIGSGLDVLIGNTDGDRIEQTGVVDLIVDPRNRDHNQQGPSQLT